MWFSTDSLQFVVDWSHRGFYLFHIFVFDGEH